MSYSWLVVVDAFLARCTLEFYAPVSCTNWNSINDVWTAPSTTWTGSQYVIGQSRYSLRYWKSRFNSKAYVSVEREDYTRKCEVTHWHSRQFVSVKHVIMGCWIFLVFLIKVLLHLHKIQLLFCEDMKSGSNWRHWTLFLVVEHNFTSTYANQTLFVYLNSLVHFANAVIATINLMGIWIWNLASFLLKRVFTLSPFVMMVYCLLTLKRQFVICDLTVAKWWPISRMIHHFLRFIQISFHRRSFSKTNCVYYGRQCSNTSMCR